MLSKKLFFLLLSALLCLNASSVILPFGKYSTGEPTLTLEDLQLVYSEQTDHKQVSHRTKVLSQYDLTLDSRYQDSINHHFCTECETYKVQDYCGFRLLSHFDEDGNLKPDDQIATLNVFYSHGFVGTILK